VIRSGRGFAFAVALAVMALGMVPYLYGWAMVGARPGLGVFSWCTFNATDNCVYFSWLRQADEGRFFQRSLFTTAAQSGGHLNLFFLLVGNVARMTGAPLALVYQGARIVVGIAFLRAVWWLIGLLVAGERTRRVCFLVVCLSSGLGWLPGLWEQGFGGPVDIWQPEAVTFLSLELFPLFAVSLLLMVGALGWLVVAERTGSRRAAVNAGLCGLVLGNVHTYDVITVVAVWGTYRAVRIVRDRRLDARAWSGAVLAAAIAAPASVYMTYLARTDVVFAHRIGMETPSAPLAMCVLGFGLVFCLAVLAATGRRDDAWVSRDARLFLVAWAVANVAVAYVPVPFQRKMLMGAHIPLAILAGVALDDFLVRLARGSRPRYAVALGASLSVLFATNARFMARTIDGITRRDEPVRYYVYAGEATALEWIRVHAAPGVPVQPLPWVTGMLEPVDHTLACMTPGATGHPVNAGHWAETPDFAGAIRAWARFVAPEASDEERRSLLRRTGVRYLVFSQKHDGAVAPFRSGIPSYLRLVPDASNADADVYEVTVPQ